jgi:hypothetical protein
MFLINRRFVAGIVGLLMCQTTIAPVVAAAQAAQASKRIAAEFAKKQALSVTRTTYKTQQSRDGENCSEFESAS